jgi:hypothetical protein
MLIYIIIRESSYDYGDKQHILKVTCNYSDALMYIKNFAKEAKCKYLKMDYEISTSYCKYTMNTKNAIFKSGDMYYIEASNYVFEIEETYIILTFEVTLPVDEEIFIITKEEGFKGSEFEEDSVSNIDDNLNDYGIYGIDDIFIDYTLAEKRLLELHYCAEIYKIRKYNFNYEREINLYVDCYDYCI